MPLNPVANPDEEAVRTGDVAVAKAVVMAGVARLVKDGEATVVASESGTLELRLMTGAIFRLGDETVTRIA